VNLLSSIPTINCFKSKEKRKTRKEEKGKRGKEGGK